MPHNFARNHPHKLRHSRHCANIPLHRSMSICNERKYIYLHIQSKSHYFMAGFGLICAVLRSAKPIVHSNGTPFSLCAVHFLSEPRNNSRNRFFPFHQILEKCFARRSQLSDTVGARARIHTLALEMLAYSSLRCADVSLVCSVCSRVRHCRFHQ